MYEFHIVHIHCGMRTIIFGYDFYDACKRSHKDPDLWEIILQEYVD